MNTSFEKIYEKNLISKSKKRTNPSVNLKYKSYCISNLRGGIGKSTLTFNIAHLLSKHVSPLVIDLCPQKNLTEVILKNHDYSNIKINTIGDSLRTEVLGSTFNIEEIPENISLEIHSKYFKNQKNGKRKKEINSNHNAYFISGDTELFSFPSSLYQQLQQAMAMANHNDKIVSKILLSLKRIIDKEAKSRQCNVTLMDCSPFYAGATHLSWCASEAMIIPVRVDAHSIDSLALTLDMLSSNTSDFNVWASRAKNNFTPKIAAIVMTMVGARSNKEGIKDQASRMYIEKAYSLAIKYKQLFDCSDPADVFVLTDDFMSSGRISGELGIPIAELVPNKQYKVSGKLLTVNQSQKNYENELNYLISVL